MEPKTIKLCPTCAQSGLEIKTLNPGDTITLVYSNECELECDNPDAPYSLPACRVCTTQENIVERTLSGYLCGKCASLTQSEREQHLAARHANEFSRHERGGTGDR